MNKHFGSSSKETVCLCCSAGGDLQFEIQIQTREVLTIWLQSQRAESKEAVKNV